ncbi:MAG: chemotaxis protein CheW [Lachnospiraceae bacterium]|nr:chemotaxis protein CheW [Lachnospiraceae bacterium]
MADANEAKQYIVVELGNELYGIDIQYIDNIVRMQRITRVPKAQAYYKGVINLRGEVIPVMSLRKRFELEEAEFTNKTRILIIKPESQSSVGIIVDAVKEVLSLEADQIDKPKVDANDEKSAYLLGVGKKDENLISILNVISVIAEKEKENENQNN